MEVSGRGYPVETVYMCTGGEPSAGEREGRAPRQREPSAGEREGPAPRQIEPGISAGRLRGAHCQGLAPAGRRDILVFQSGEREIFDSAHLLKKRFGDRFDILPLYARLPSAEQQRIFAPGDRQRIVLATNVAETSITVPNIGYVVDPGLARISRYSYRAKLQRLPIEPISQASAAQRAGRCAAAWPRGSATGCTHKADHQCASGVHGPGAQENQPGGRGVDHAGVPVRRRSRRSGSSNHPTLARCGTRYGCCTNSRPWRTTS